MPWFIGRIKLVLAAVMLCLIAALHAVGAAQAQQSPFGDGWDLRPEASVIRFQSVKKSTVVESSSFATITGAIGPDGTATLEILLDSVDTKIDLRNVRMRFLFFETFKFPMAKVNLTLDPTMLSDLQTVRRKVITVPYTLDLHGISNASTAEIAVTLLSDDMVSVASSTPISIAVSDFGLAEGIAKLEEAAGVVIVPSATVTFDLTFARRATATPAPAEPEPAAEVTAAAEPTAEPATAVAASAALESQGDFSREECVGRLEILSRTGNIFFRSASARLDEKSRFLLDALSDIVKRCPDLVVEVAGYTDSVGSDDQNLRLSEARARSVAVYMAEKGVIAERIRATGYGEIRPVATNDTAEGRARNRRIEFSAVN